MLLFNRRQIFAIASVLSIASPQTADAQAYPSRSVTLNSSFAAGSPQDLILRAMAEVVAADFKQSVVVDNKLGAGISMGHGVTQKPDGYTINAEASATIVNLPLMQKLAFDPARDFDYIMQIASFPVGIVVKADGPSSPGRISSLMPKPILARSPTVHLDKALWRTSACSGCRHYPAFH